MMKNLEAIRDQGRRRWAYLTYLRGIQKLRKYTHPPARLAQTELDALSAGSRYHNTSTMAEGNLAHETFAFMKLP